MEPTRLKVLEAEIRDRWAAIQDVYATVEVRAAGLRSDDPASLEGLAYQLHNLYSAVEELFGIVADAFENSVADIRHWHTELLDRMRLEIEGVRPALISKEVYPLLYELRAFRHLFRHAYGRPLREDRVLAVRAVAAQVRPLLERDLARFLQRLGAGLQ